MGVCPSKDHDSEPYKYRHFNSVSAPSPKPVDKSDTILGEPLKDVKKFYRLGKELGRGQFGVTYICTEKSTGKKYACKSISKKTLVREGDKENVNREIQIMRHLSGQPNIVEFKGAYEDEHSVHVVMELCPGGDLFDRINAKGPYSERAAASICRQIVNVVHICHLMGVMHRDLKPENFLLSSKDDKKALLKATDFGLSVFIEEGKILIHLLVICFRRLWMDGIKITKKSNAFLDYAIRDENEAEQARLSLN